MIEGDSTIMVDTPVCPSYPWWCVWRLGVPTCWSSPQVLFDDVYLELAPEVLLWVGPLTTPPMHVFRCAWVVALALAVVVSPMWGDLIVPTVLYEARTPIPHCVYAK